MLKNATDVDKILVYNIVGRQVKTFRVDSSGDKYTVSDLPKGMYVIRLVDTQDDLIQTLRLNLR